MADEKLKLMDLTKKVTKKEDGERIDKVGIIGAGIMGQGIAQTIAAKGVDVIVVEKDEPSLKNSIQNLTKSMENEIARWSLTKSELKGIMAKIKWSIRMEDIKDCDLIIEAVEENIDVKVKIFKELEELAKPHTIFVSNTSTLSLTKIGEKIKRRDRFIGMHFIHPVPKIPIVELGKEVSTSEKTVHRIKDFLKKIGKRPIEVYEYPGFITTRVMMPMINESIHILMEGLADTKEIDCAIKLGFNFKMGPLEMADAMGLDDVLSWMKQLWNALGEPQFRPCPLIRKLVREKKLGKKVGEGFYKYDAQGKIIS
ncbi:MAG: NAD(P)-binding domain-containing protein [Ignavibacteriales bacterium]|nr:NAD(P)-binding domain-containing protein [Ignavibacteriales bacterium]